VESTLAVGAGGSDAGDRLRLGRMELLMIFAFWTFMAVLTAANALLDPRGRGLQPNIASAPIALAFIESYLWALATPFIFLLSSRYSFERTRWLSRVLLFLAVGIVVAIFVDSIITWLRFDVFFTPRRGPPPGRSLPGPLMGIVRLWYLNELIVYIAVLAAGFARDYFLRYRGRVEETARLQAHAAQLQAQLAEARLSALRTQLDPHFLFNTLHAVSALVERDPRGVRKMISRLSELLRHNLEGAGEQEVPLEQEMKVTERYLEIMQIRFQGRLELEIRMDPAAAGALVPSLVLQPLVENAIKHGVSRTGGTGKIEITAARRGERVVLRVLDNGPGPAADPSEGVGLRNTRDRLAELYGGEASLSLAPAEGSGTLAEVSLPYHTRADLHAAGIAAPARGAP
jgi:two-component system LytT family sensor kinase